MRLKNIQGKLANLILDNECKNDIKDFLDKGWQ